MIPEFLRSTASLITDSSILNRVFADAARFAASWGHDEVSDFHCFPALLIGFPDDPITTAALGGRPIADFLATLEQIVKRKPPIPEVSGATCLLQRLIYRMCADENDVLRLGSIGIAHFYLAYISRVEGCAYNLYEWLDIDANALIPKIVHAAGIGYPDHVILYYQDLHDTWYRMRNRVFEMARKNSRTDP